LQQQQQQQIGGNMDTSLARSASCRGPLETVPETAAANFAEDAAAAAAAAEALLPPASSPGTWQQQQQVHELYQQQLQNAAVLMQQQQQQAYGCGGALCGSMQCNSLSGGCVANVAR
jgi:hypothetical protein